MTPIVLALLLAAAAPPPPAPVPASPPSPAPAQTPAAPAPLDPAFVAVSAKVDAMMTPYKGKPLTELTQRLGPNESMRPAADGKVLFWRTRGEPGTKCGLNASGAFTCSPVWGKECLLAVAVDLQSNILAWKLSGDPAACEVLLKPPPPAV